jgi:predicted metal-dependent HD superfamily phosphohydrolase
MVNRSSSEHDREQVQFLQHDWQDLVVPCSPAARAADEVLAELVRLYSSEGRYYHNLDHLQDVLRTVHVLAHLATDLAAVRFAAWFHDAIYDPRASNNEERSAALCAQRLALLGVPSVTLAAAVEMIRATRDHRPRGRDLDTAILLDADLAILGASTPEYARYAAAIRQEYAWAPEPDYRRGRRMVLESFLARPRLYLTAPMLPREGQARQNLAAEIAALQ